MPTIMKAMEFEHTSPELPDTSETFTSSNGVTTTSATEWEFVLDPDKDRFAKQEYPERMGLRESNPKWCRLPRSLEQLREDTEENANSHLRTQGHSELMDEEVVSVRLCMPQTHTRHACGERDLM